MKRIFKILPSVTGALVAVVCTTSSADMVISAPDASNALAIENFQVANGTVNGEIVNRTQHRLENIELRVNYDWLWRNEFKPGDPSPGWIATYAVPGTLAPGEKYEFHYTPEQQLIAREDGRFAPTVGVVSYTEFAGGESH